MSREHCGTVGLQGVRRVWVGTPLEACVERNEARQGAARVPLVGSRAARDRFVAPGTAEGFDRVDVLRP